MRLLDKVGLSFDDVVLIPQHSDIPTRKVVLLNTTLHTLLLWNPFISANMDSITGLEMAQAMARNGGLGILHRYQTSEEIISQIKELKSSDLWAVPSIGVKKEDKELLLRYKDAGADAVCIDVAHADHRMCLDITETAAKHFKTVISGNVVTKDAARRLYNAGAKVIKIGIGNGSACTTRVVTGHGVPQITALLDICPLKYEFDDLFIISDGGIRNSGDCVKALGCGADAVMIGSLFAGCDETPSFGGTKLYRGMASRQAREQFYGAHDAVPEGEAVSQVKSKGPVADVIAHLAGGVRSGLSYSGATTLEEFHRMATFMQVTHSAHIEGTPHILHRV